MSLFTFQGELVDRSRQQCNTAHVSRNELSVGYWILKLRLFNWLINN
uniref:Uncharacterized protein n=1 Tax=Arundo donax TaxID=35708 RepID=A0A0A8ZXU7_ARUDO